MALSSGYWNEAVTIMPLRAFVNRKRSKNGDFTRRYCVKFASEGDGCGCHAIGSGGRAFGSYQRAGERYALAAFGSTAEASIGAARGIRAAPHGFLQILFANGIADTDDHEALPDSGNISNDNGSQ